MRHLNNLEKKRIYLIVLFVLGLVMGVPGTVAFSSNKSVREYVWAHTGIEIKRWSLPHLGIMETLIYVLVSLVAMLAVTVIIRFFRSSKTLPLANHVVRLLVAVGVGLPFSVFLFVKADRYVQKFNADVIVHLVLNLISLLFFLALYDRKGLFGRFVSLVIQIAVEIVVVRYFHLGNELKSIRGTIIMELRFGLLVLLFATLFCYLTVLLGDMCFEILKYPSRRCRLEVYQVMATDRYNLSRKIVRGKQFEKCYQTMKLNKDTLLPTQFFRITETGPLGAWEVQHWNYYGNCEIMRLQEEEIAPVFWKSVREAVGGEVYANPEVANLFDDNGMGPGFG